jgi:Tfp pilus assembly protein PilF
LTEVKSRGENTEERDCRAILETEPGNADALHLLGLISRQSGKLGDAERFIHRSIELLPNRVEFRVNFSNLLRATGQLQSAEAELRIALEIEPGSRTARLALARLLNHGGVPEQAEIEARRLIERDPRDAEAWHEIGVAQRGLNRIEEAESSYRRALAVSPEYANVRHNLGALLCQMDRAEESLAELDRAAELGAIGPELHLNRGTALLKLGRLDEAEAALLAAINLAPGNLDSHTLLAKLRYMRGDEEYTRELASAASQGGDPGLALALGDLLRRGGQLTAAEAILRELDAGNPGLPQLEASLAVVLQEQGMLSEAVELARNARAARPDDAEISENLIAILLQLGEVDESWPLIMREQKRAPLDQRWLAYQATAARLAGKPEYDELYNYTRFVLPFDLEPPAGYASIDEFNAALIERLVEKHRLETHPLDQSLRHGTQTSRDLLADPDPLIKEFIRLLEGPISAYREAIGFDPGHRFLERNRGATKLVGCWSVRLKRGGYHVNHIHPEGWISSAYYVQLPAEVEDTELKSGWIKFGEPRMPTPGASYAHIVRPKPGRLVLFPSYMWHGTTPINGDEPRMTIAFDAVTTSG